MYYLGLIDDREDSREALKLSINLPLDDMEWEVVDTPPLDNLHDYVYWINENEVSVIVIDEKLNEQSPTSFFGHDVVQYLRTFYPDLPIFCITSFAREENLNSRYKLYNFITSKSDFEARRDEFVNLMIKSGADFYDKFNEKKNRISELSQKKAINELSEAEENELNLLHEFIMGNFGSENNDTLDSWINEFSKNVKDFELLTEEIRKHIKNDLGEDC